MPARECARRGTGEFPQEVREDPQIHMVAVVPNDRSSFCSNSDLMDFEQKEDLSFDQSGTTATIMIRHDQEIHMGWVGDSNVGG